MMLSSSWLKFLSLVTQNTLTPWIKIFPGDTICRLPQWNVAAPIPHLPLYTVVCMKDMPFDLISSSLLNFPGGLANVNVMFQATRTTQHGNIPPSFTSAKCFFWFIVFFLIEFGSSLLIRWSFNTVYQLQERVILYSSYFHSEGRLFNLYCVQNLLPVIFSVFYLCFYHINFSSYLTSNNKNKIQRGAFSDQLS